MNDSNKEAWPEPTDIDLDEIENVTELDTKMNELFDIITKPDPFLTSSADAEGCSLAFFACDENVKFNAAILIFYEYVTILSKFKLTTVSSEPYFINKSIITLYVLVPDPVPLTLISILASPLAISKLLA